jgi:hypothetical protein
VGVERGGADFRDEVAQTRRLRRRQALTPSPPLQELRELPQAQAHARVALVEPARRRAVEALAERARQVEQVGAQPTSHLGRAQLLEDAAAGGRGGALPLHGLLAAPGGHTQSLCPLWAGVGRLAKGKRGGLTNIVLPNLRHSRLERRHHTNRACAPRSARGRASAAARHGSRPLAFQRPSPPRTAQRRRRSHAPPRPASSHIGGRPACR